MPSLKITRKLRFYCASSSQQKLPYSFQPLEQGVFASHSSYSSVQLDHFSGATVGQEEDMEKICCTSLFYLSDSERKKQLDLVITLNLDAYITVRVAYVLAIIVCMLTCIVICPYIGCARGVCREACSGCLTQYCRV